MSLTPPPDTTVVYGGPLTVRWDVPDLGFSTALAFPQDLVDTLDDTGLQSVLETVDAAVCARFPEVQVSRVAQWTPQAMLSDTTTVVQEGHDGD